ncbi:hypothetical protein Q8F55_008084 [Vanrija albida]|uniref:Uncharacterized protein n=1 Tax=Vanrija albida TaxID=181172 RepID=A0ABR3PVF6_9TREE
MSFFSSLFGRASSSSPAVTGSTSLPPSATLSAGRSPTYTTTRYTHVEQPHGACPYPPEDRSPTPPPRRVVRRRVVTDRPRPPAPEALSPRARSPTLDPEAEGEAEGDRPPSPNYSPLSPDPRDAPEAPDVPRYPQPL